VAKCNNSFLADDEFEDLCFQYGVEVEFGTAEEM
jgi:hypothetical protein